MIELELNHFAAFRGHGRLDRRPFEPGAQFIQQASQRGHKAIGVGSAATAASMRDSAALMNPCTGSFW